MRTGPRTVVACALAFAALCAPAHAADTLSVFVDNEKVAVGGATTVAAHAETDAGYGGGHIAFRYKPGGEQCLPTPGEDDGLDASGGTLAPVDAGASAADVGGQLLQLELGSWRICGWLVDDVTGATVATASTVVTVVPYIGSVSVRVKRVKRVLQLALSYSTSSVAKLYVFLQTSGRVCPTSLSRISKRAVLLVPKSGRTIGSDGGLGKSVRIDRLGAGRWRACALMISEFGGAAAGSRAFSVPHLKRHASRAAG